MLKSNLKSTSNMYNSEYYEKWYRKNRDKKIHQTQEWRAKNPEKKKKTQKEYNQRPSVKQKRQVHNAIRRHELGFFQLNDYFEGSVVHHISRNFVIHIPEEIHKSIWHCLWTGKNMDAINKLAIEFI